MNYRSLLTVITLSGFFILPVHAQLTFEQTYMIGEERHSNSGYLFAGIKNLKLMGDTLLISDLSDASIRLFNSNGEFLYKIGQRGRGPVNFMKSPILLLTKTLTS